MGSHSAQRLQERQLWGLPSWTTTTSSQVCASYTLLPGGVISFAPDNIVTLSTNVIFQPVCTGASSVGLVNSSADLDDPFYASTTPQTYVIAAATVIAWVLVIMLVIAPRTFITRSAARATNFTSGRGILSGASGACNPMVGVGSRPWLQKAAALTVAISLTIATADTFKVAKQQYHAAYLDADALREQVEDSLEIRITRVVSDIFLWLAQVQTLIRLFPRHKEKVLIKWIGFCLIVLDTTFSSLNSFYVNSPHRPRDFVDAIPALSYLFELALGLLYAAWVIYYAMTKRRYAFYHSSMKNISLIALLSLISLLTPVVFFVTDVTIPDVAGWGDYFRWVGAAASSVVVWEWVERIEAIEGDEKKDGILGREIFDGDEMLDMTPLEGMTYTRRRKDDYFPRGRGVGNAPVKPPKTQRHGLRTVVRRFGKSRPQNLRSDIGVSSDTTTQTHGDRKAVVFGHLPRPDVNSSTGVEPVALNPVASPPPRTDTTSAASTVYVVQENHGADGPQLVRRRPETPRQPVIEAKPEGQSQSQVDGSAQDEGASTRKQGRKPTHSAWHTVHNPFQRKRASPPAEVRAALATSEALNEGGKDSVPGKTRSSPLSPSARWDVKGRLGEMTAGLKQKPSKFETRAKPAEDMPWTVIPAPPRGGAAWSPQLSTAQRNDDSAALQVMGLRSAGQPSGQDSQQSPQNSNHSSGSSGSQTAVGSDRPRRVVVTPLRVSNMSAGAVLSPDAAGDLRHIRDDYSDNG